MTHRCYSCHGLYQIQELSYECMCFHPEDTIRYRGICKACKDVSETDWKEVPDNNHHFRKRHEYSKEATEILTNIQDTFKGNLTQSVHGDMLKFSNDNTVLWVNKNDIKCLCCPH